MGGGGAAGLGEGEVGPLGAAAGSQGRGNVGWNGGLGKVGDGKRKKPAERNQEQKRT